MASTALSATPPLSKHPSCCCHISQTPPPPSAPSLGHKAPSRIWGLVAPNLAPRRWHQQHSTLPQPPSIKHGTHPLPHLLHPTCPALTSAPPPGTIDSTKYPYHYQLSLLGMEVTASATWKSLSHRAPAPPASANSYKGYKVCITHTAATQPTQLLVTNGQHPPSVPHLNATPQQHNPPIFLLPTAITCLSSTPEHHTSQHPGQGSTATR